MFTTSRFVVWEKKTMPQTLDIRVKMRKLCLCDWGMNNAWVAALMWDIEFPANQRRDCVSVPKPQRTATLASKGVVWTHSRTNTNVLFFSLGHWHAYACTRASAHVKLLNRNTQHAVSRTWSLGFGWREAQFSTPVFRAVIRGLVQFSGSERLTHMCCEVHRETTEGFSPPCSICWTRDEECQWAWKALNDL